LAYHNELDALIGAVERRQLRLGPMAIGSRLFLLADAATGSGD
jgi:hypothetical protein